MITIESGSFGTLQKITEKYQGRFVRQKERKIPKVIIYHLRFFYLEFEDRIFSALGQIQLTLADN